MKNRAGQLAAGIVLVALVALTLYPFVFMLQKSVQSNVQIAGNFWGLQFPLQWRYYASAWSTVWPLVFNSVKVSALTVAGVLVLSSMSAFCFARYRFVGKNVIYYCVLGLLMVPDVLTLVTRFILVRDLGLLDTHAALILPGIATLQVVAIFILRGFFETLPEELFESARIDGASEWTVYCRLALPMSLPILATVGVLTLLAVWNDYIWPLVTLDDPSRFTIPLGLADLENLSTRLQVGEQMAGYVLGSLPLLVVFFLAMRTFLRGFTAGAIKG